MPSSLGRIHSCLLKSTARYIKYRCLHGLPPNGARRKRVILGMSGGVDSSVSAYLLKNKGYQVEGVYMRNWDEKDERDVCNSDDDWQDVMRVCKTLDIPCHRVDFSKEYWINVFDTFISDLSLGKTPNPDIACNREIKFGAFFNRYIRDSQTGFADLIATGHYARLHRTTNTTLLLRAIDPQKDQTYYLSNVPCTALSRTLFPIGGYTKSHVKRIAVEAGLDFAAKKRESMGICFVGKRSFGDFLDEYLVQTFGDFVSVVDGTVLGKHKGLARYTIGQKARISGESEKWYVAEKDPSTNNIYIAPGASHPSLYRSTLTTSTIHWIATHHPPQLTPTHPLHLHVKYCYRAPAVPATIYQLPEGGYKVEFGDPQFGVAIGQQVVLYDGEICLGGGIIENVGSSEWINGRSTPP